ncbi:MAG: hypothetical protein ACD_46C00080G0002 [uncultured bacterium]|nr:MAG: hypothetical protein ACD_46C00080G0002 [uncultured bacterium]
MKCKRFIIDGFTLIELTVIISLIGVLAAVAITKFIYINSDAQTAATQAIASALSASNANNYTSRKLSSGAGIAISNCIDLSNTLKGGLPSGYSIMANATTANVNIACTLIGPNSTSAAFTATGIN